MDIVGSIIAGKHGSILIRQKSGSEVELGDLLLVKQKNASLLLQVYDIVFGSQIPAKHLEMISGMKLEGYGADLDFMDPALRNYVLAQVKAVARVEDNKVRIPKTLPPFMGNVRHITKDDLAFLVKPPHPVYLGKVRSHRIHDFQRDTVSTSSPEPTSLLRNHFLLKAFLSSSLSP